jgi:spore germination cell wall hydrolase CwlJ-like protein
VNTDELSAAQRNDLNCMTLNIYHEARGTPFNNQLAVALVVVNRQRIIGGTLCQVLHAPGQFAWTRRRLGRISEPVAWDLSQRIAYMVMFDPEVPDITRGSTHFHERSMSPNWSKRSTQKMVIGAHVFVRVRSYEELAMSR